MGLVLTCSHFYLQGGKTEYVVTIASVIGKSRMKGKKRLWILG